LSEKNAKSAAFSPEIKYLGYYCAMRYFLFLTLLNLVISTGYSSNNCDVLLVKFDKELPVVSVKDQCDWETCWIVSTLYQAEMMLEKKTGKKIELSYEFQLFKFLETEYKNIIHTGLVDSRAADDELIFEGGGFFVGKANIFDHGLVPESEWKPVISILEEENKTELIERLDNIVINFLKLDENQREGFKQLTLKELEKIFDEYTGGYPQSFNLSGNELTPDELRKALMEVNQEPIIYRNTDDILGSKTFNYVNGTKTIEMELMIYQQRPEEMLMIIEKEIDAGKPVGLSMKTVSKSENRKLFIDHEAGIMTSSKKVNIPEVTGEHALSVFGYKLDKKGRVSHLKILNSYGKDNGVNGVYVMDREHFKKFINGIEIWR
jgi:hypothetical protein